VRELASASAVIGQHGRDAADRVQRALDANTAAGPPGRVALVEEVGRALDVLRTELRSVPIGAHGWLLPPLGSARHRLVERLDKADRQLGDAQKIASALHGFLAGPRRFLILGGNNAEMRALPVTTTAGAATVLDGEVSVGDFLDTSHIDLPYPGVSFPSDWKPLYEWLGPGQAYTSAVMSPNFPLAAEVSSRISEHNEIGAVDGVIFVDTFALQSLLGVLGPVTVDGTTYDGNNAARILINENYLRFQTRNESPERRDTQGKVAKAIFDAINSRQFTMTKLAATLLDLTKERHLLAWSRDPVENEMWDLVGASGALAPNSFLIASQDLGGSKLDYYVNVDVRAAVESLGDRRRVDLAITLTNPTRSVSSAYIDGGSIYADPGEYGSFLAVYMPRSVLGVKNDDPGISYIGPDGNVSAAVVELRVPQGTSKTVRFEFFLPNSERTLEIVPSARLRPITYAMNTLSFNDAVPITLNLERLARNEPTPAWLLMGLLLLGLGMGLVGDAWGRMAVAVDDPASRRARIDASVGWWIAVSGLALIAVYVGLWITPQ
jgi:hypothetical protein